MAEPPAVVTRRDGPVEYVLLDRGHRRNAMTFDNWAELHAALLAATASDSRVVVVGGAGDHFCSGGDLAGGDRGQHSYRLLDDVARTCQALVELPKPTIARVDDLATGAGLGLALSCDVVVATDRARFGTMFVARGLSPDFGTSWLLPRLVGLRTAKRLCLLPELFDAATAERLGLVDEVVAPEDLAARTDALAARFADGPPIALALTKKLLNGALSSTLGEALAAETAAQTVNRMSADAAEGRAAFAERRPPRFEGR